MFKYKHSKSFTDFEQLQKSKYFCKICKSNNRTSEPIYLNRKQCKLCLQIVCKKCMNKSIATNNKSYCIECCQSLLKVNCLDAYEKKINDLVNELELCTSQKEENLRKLYNKISYTITTKEKYEAFCMSNYEKIKEFEQIIYELKSQKNQKKIVVEQFDKLVEEVNSNLSKENEVFRIAQLEYDLAKEYSEDSRSILFNLKNKLAELQDEKIRQFRYLESLNHPKIDIHGTGRIISKHDKLRLTIKEESQILEEYIEKNDTLEEEIICLESSSNDLRTDDTFYEEIEYKELSQKLQDQQANILKIRLDIEKRKEHLDISSNSCNGCIMY